MSLYQPWASLVALGVKTIETRSWSTSYRGPLAIHAAKHRPVDGEGIGLPWDVSSPKLSRMVTGIDGWSFRRRDPWSAWMPLPLGAVVATCVLVDVLPITGPNDAGLDEFVCPDIGGGLTLYRFAHGGSRPATTDDDITSQLPYGDFSEGRYAWILDDIVAFDPPVEASGRQGLWEWSS